jgi:hypothetical protein
MKKIKLLTILAVLFFASCEKNGTYVNEENQINEIAIAQVQTSQNPVEQKSMYKLLNSSEKAEIWKQKFRTALLNQDLNSEQRDFLVKLEKYVSHELFASKVKHDDTEIKSSAIRLFGVSIAQSLLTNLSQSFSLQVASSGRGCGCSTDSNWCGGNSTCDRGNCGYSQSGCGTLWWYGCDGSCQAHAEQT